MSKLRYWPSNHTIFISGASRGIGLEIAKKAAADGANIIVAAKTAEVGLKFVTRFENYFLYLIFLNNFLILNVLLLVCFFL